MSQLDKTKRQWRHPEGYRYLAPWTNAALLRSLIRLLTAGFPKGEYRRKTQMDDAARSVVRNIEEGFKRPDTKSYLDFLGFSQGSLEEVKGDVRECLEDGLLKSVPGSSLKGIGIDLENFKGWLRDHKTSPNLPYPHLTPLTPEDLTYEIFLELINKTDYLTRKLVESLQAKMKRDEDHEKFRAAQTWERKHWS